MNANSYKRYLTWQRYDKPAKLIGMKTGINPILLLYLYFLVNNVNEIAIIIH